MTWGQIVFKENADFKADYLVFEVDREYKADLLVYMVDREYKAKGNEGLWFFTNGDSRLIFRCSLWIVTIKQISPYFLWTGITKHGGKTKQKCLNSIFRFWTKPNVVSLQHTTLI